MPGIRSAARPLAGATRRATTKAGERAFGMKQKRGVVPAAGREMTSARRAGHEDSPYPRPKRVKVIDDDVNMKPVTFAPAATAKIPVNAGQERFKKRLAAEFDALCELVKKAEALSRGKTARSSPRPEAPVVARDKAPPAKRRKMSPLVEQIQIDARQMSPEEGEIVVVPEEDEDCIDICGGVSHVAIRHESPLVSLNKADDQSKINIVPADEEEQDECVDICGGTPLAPLKVASEAFSPTYSSSDSDSGSNSDDSSSDSDSESDSDSNESVDSPAPAADPPPKENNSPAQATDTVTSAPPPTEKSTKPKIDYKQTVSSSPPRPALPEKIDSPAQPPAPASSVMAQSTEPKQNLPISVLLAKAKEAREIQAQKGPGWEREKTRRMVREMEEAVLPDESIHLRDLEQVGIKQFDYVLEELLGISLRPDV